jgi:hypothetical protein
MVGWGKKEQDTITLSSVKHSTDWQANRQTDKPTDRHIFAVLLPWLKANLSNAIDFKDYGG